MGVMSLRLNKQALDRISKLSEQKKEAKSEVVRELLNEGWIFFWLKLYSAGKVSMGKMSEELDMPINEVMDLLAELGTRSQVRYDDYLEGFENLKQSK